MLVSLMTFMLVSVMSVGLERECSSQAVFLFFSFLVRKEKKMQKEENIEKLVKIHNICPFFI